MRFLHRHSLAAMLTLLIAAGAGAQDAPRRDRSNARQRALEALEGLRKKPVEPVRSEVKDDDTRIVDDREPAQTADSPVESVSNGESELPTFTEVAPEPPAQAKRKPKPVESKPDPPQRVIIADPAPAAPRPVQSNPVRLETEAQEPQTPRPQPRPRGRALKPAEPIPTTYRIEPGDTFTKIADKIYGDQSKWIAIAKANPLVDPIRLKVGQVIRLPDLSEQAKLRAEELRKIRASVTSDASLAKEQSVVVEPGDSLGGIARRVYGDARFWRVIFEANEDQLDDPNRIRVGMKLKVPVKLGDPAGAPR